jgi:hypothetical protein
MTDVDWPCRNCGAACPEPSAELWTMLDAMNVEVRKRAGWKQVGVKEALMCRNCYRIHRLAPHTSGVDLGAYGVPK